MTGSKQVIMTTFNNVFLDLGTIHCLIMNHSALQSVNNNLYNTVLE